MKKKTIIAVLLGIAIAFIASDAIAGGSGHHVDVNGVVCPTNSTGAYSLDVWGQCEEPREMKLYFGDSWDDEKKWIYGTLLFFLLIGPVIFMIIPFVPMLLSPAGKWIWAVGTCVWIVTDPWNNWGWLHSLVGV